MTIESIIDQYLEEAEMPASKSQGDNGEVTYSSDIDFNEQVFRLTIYLDPNQKTVTVLYGSPENIPEPNRSTVADYLMRCNFHSYEGNFILDSEDGSIAYKYSILYDDKVDCSLLPAQIDAGIITAIEDMETYHPFMISIINDDLSAEQAHSQAVRAANPELN